MKTVRTNALTDMTIGILSAVIVGLTFVSTGIAQETELKNQTFRTTTPVSRMDQAWWKQRHEQWMNEKEAVGDIDILLLGDSITQGWETTGKAAWKKTFGQYKTFNLGFSGDRTEHVIWRLQNGQVQEITPKVVMLLIGTNNTGHNLDKPADIALGVRKILDELETRLPDSKVLLLSLFPYDKDSDSPRRKNNNAVNEIISGFGDEQRVFYMDICDTFFAENGEMSKEITPDFLHLSPLGYQRWADAVKEKIVALMQ